MPTRWQFVIRFDTESVEKLTFALLQRSVGVSFSCKASVNWRPCQSQNSSRCLLPHLNPPPSHFLCHYARFPWTKQALFIRIPALGCHYTLSSFATMGAFLSPPRPPLFPTESPRASELSDFGDTFNKTSQPLLCLIMESEGQWLALRYKGQSNANISFTCRTMTVKFQRIPWGNGGFWHSD